MKKIFLVLIFALYSNIHSTEQIPDLLIINKDTVLLDSSPLSQLLFKGMPFGKSAPNTGCWRGYQAVWVVENKRLFLKELIPCEPDKMSNDFNI